MKKNLLRIALAIALVQAGVVPAEALCFIVCSESGPSAPTTNNSSTEVRDETPITLKPKVVNTQKGNIKGKVEVVMIAHAGPTARVGRDNVGGTVQAIQQMSSQNSFGHTSATDARATTYLRMDKSFLPNTASTATPSLTATDSDTTNLSVSTTPAAPAPSKS